MNTTKRRAVFACHLCEAAFVSCRLRRQTGFRFKSSTKVWIVGYRCREFCCSRHELLRRIRLPKILAGQLSLPFQDPKSSPRLLFVFRRIVFWSCFRAMPISELRAIIRQAVHPFLKVRFSVLWSSIFLTKDGWRAGEKDSDLYTIRLMNKSCLDDILEIPAEGGSWT